MATKPRTLELTVLSAEGLRMSGNTANKSVFAVVHADTSTASHTTATTMENNNGFYSWNKKFAVELGPHAKCLMIEVKCMTGAGAVRDVGVARITVSDFLGGLVPDHCLQFLCYRLKDWDGRGNGVVNFSVKVVAGAGAAAPPAASGPCGFRINAEKDYCSSSASSSSGVVIVTGIPVSWNNSSTTACKGNV